MTRDGVPDPLDGLSPDGAVDPDVDVHVGTQRSEWRTRRWSLPAASVGGMVGAGLRFGVEQALPQQGTGWPIGTFLVNVSGCFLLAVLMASLHVAGREGSLWRVFLGVGVLGGYTTFSTYAVQAADQIRSDEPMLAVTYLLVTVVAAGTAVLLGLVVGRRAGRARARSSR